VPFIHIFWAPTESLNTLLDDNKKLCLMSGEIIQMTNQMSMIFEPADLEQASPATVSRCGMIYLEPRQLGWPALKDSYMNKLPPGISADQKVGLEEMFDWIIQPAFDFIRTECTVFIKSSELHLFQVKMIVFLLENYPFVNASLVYYLFLWKQNFVRLYSCILRGESGTDDQGSQSSLWLQFCFIFAVVWSLGSTLVADSREKFSAFYRVFLNGNNKDYPRPKTFKLNKNQLFPEKGTVFDYICDKRNNQWIFWQDTIDREHSKIQPNAKVKSMVWTMFMQGYVPRQIKSIFLQVSELIIPTDETARQVFFLKVFLNNDIPLMFIGKYLTNIENVFLRRLRSKKPWSNATGPTGTGKSAITLNYLMGLPKEKFIANVINFSARTTANQTQDIIMSKLDRRKKGVFGPTIGKKCVVFVDDLSMPQKESKYTETQFCSKILNAEFSDVHRRRLRYFRQPL